MVQLDRPAAVAGDIPVTLDPIGGIYFRTQNRGSQIVIGSVLERDEKETVESPDDFARYAEDSFIRSKLFLLQHRLPELMEIKGVKNYSGLYTVNENDMHPIVGKTSIDGFIVANGFSGHGFKLAPAIGSLIAQHVTDERLVEFDTHVDLDFLSIQRTPILLKNKNVLA